MRHRLFPHSRATMATLAQGARSPLTVTSTGRVPTTFITVAPSEVTKRLSSTTNARWLSESKARIGKLLFHGTNPEETREAGEILQLLSQSWRNLVAGPEGYLVSPDRCGLYRFPVNWGDMDSMVKGHVNNVTYTRWAESARINWAGNLARHVDPANNAKWSELWTPHGLGLILKSIKVDYKFPMEYPDKVSVYHKLSKTKSESFALDVIMLSEKHQRVAARCLEDIVVYNYKPAAPSQAPGKAPIPEFMRRVFDDTLKAQKKAAEDAEKARTEIGNMISQLESKVLAKKEVKP